MSMVRSVILSFVFGVAIVAHVGAKESLKVRYDDYHVYRVEPEKDHQIEFLKLYQNYSTSIIFVDGIHLSGQFINAVVAPHKVNEFEKALTDKNIKYKSLETNFEKFHPESETTIEFDEFHAFKRSLTWFYQLERDFPNLVHVVTYGRSYESLPLACVRISAPSISSKPRSAVFIEAGINGQEWIGPAAALYIINELITSTDENVYRVSRDYDWYIVPYVNPDGYEYSRGVNRLWRKTRSPQGDDYGANMNLNFDYKWGQAGANNYTCSPNYPGKTPFSEIETKNLVHYLSSLKPIRFYFALHAYGQTIEYPYADNTVPRDELLRSKMPNICDHAAKAMKKRYGSVYTCNNQVKQKPQSGTSTDYVYSNSLAQFVLNLFLRPKKSFCITGYELPENEIVPTAQEALDGIVGFIMRVEEMWPQESGKSSIKTLHGSPGYQNGITVIHDDLF